MLTRSQGLRAGPLTRRLAVDSELLIAILRSPPLSRLYRGLLSEIYNNHNRHSINDST